MHPALIKAQLKMKGFTLRKVADSLNVTESCVGRVVNGKARSRIVANKVSIILGIPVSRLWPGDYPKIELAEIREGRSAA